MSRTIDRLDGKSSPQPIPLTTMTRYACQNLTSPKYSNAVIKVEAIRFAEAVITSNLRLSVLSAKRPPTVPKISMGPIPKNPTNVTNKAESVS